MPISQEHPKKNSTGWMLQRLARIAEETLAQHLGDMALSIEQFAVLMTVLEEPGLTQAQIGNRFAMPAYTISRSLDYLERAGFVERKPHPSSRRAFQIVPTNAGKELAPALFQAVAESNTHLARSLNQTERTTLNTLLKKILSDLGGA